jgi:hypothetical protein
LGNNKAIPHDCKGVAQRDKSLMAEPVLPLQKQKAMMRSFYSIVLISLLPIAGMAQIGVGTTSLDATAMLQVNASASTNAKGFLGPRVALSSTSANTPFSVTPATGIMVYNTATAGSGSTAVTPGYYSFNGTSWDRLAAQPVTFVDGSPAPLRMTAVSFYDGSEVLPSNIGTITLPPGRWEIKGLYTILVNSPGYLYSGGGNWSLYPLQYYLLFLTDDTQAAPVYINHGLGNTATTTSHSIVASGAKALVGNGPQEVTFFINNNTGADRTYKLWFNESYGGPSGVLNTLGYDGQMNSFHHTNTNRLYATKIQ